jgi:hypothetical protein
MRSRKCAPGRNKVHLDTAVERRTPIRQVHSAAEPQPNKMPPTQRRRGRREPQSFFLNHGWTRINTDQGETRIYANSVSDNSHNSCRALCSPLSDPCESVSIRGKKIFSKRNEVMVWHSRESPVHADSEIGAPLSVMPHSYSVKGVLPKWNGARAADPQQPGVRTGAGNSVGFRTVERAAAHRAALRRRRNPFGQRPMCAWPQ